MDSLRESDTKATISRIVHLFFRALKARVDEQLKKSYGFGVADIAKLKERYPLVFSRNPKLAEHVGNKIIVEILTSDEGLYLPLNDPCTHFLTRYSMVSLHASQLQIVRASRFLLRKQERREPETQRRHRVFSGVIS